jgi:thiol:disulfide interchange protein
MENRDGAPSSLQALMDRMRSSAVPILLIVIFGIAFAAGIRNLASNQRSNHGEKGSGKLNLASDTTAAFATAKKEDKVVMVKYGAEWCPPCVEMKEEAFASAKVAEALKDVIVVDIDVDNPGADADWMREHRSGGSIPTVTFFRADGTVIGETVGYGGVDKFVSEIEKILAKT